VAGPIKRYEQFLPSVHKALQEVCSRDVMTGMVQMCLGFSKKLIADNLTLWVESSHGSYADMSLESRWMFFAAIGFRILLDFSGYSDIAIGLARMMGITIPPNFNWPYLSTNIRDFWHRWHISLSSWIRDYVYIPLGGNRHGNFRRFLNGLVAFSLCGLWHGPAWNFVLWGLYHGLGLSISNAYRQIPFGIGMRLEQTFHRVPLLGWAVTLLFVWLGWLLFFYPAPEAWRMAKLLFVF
jgi:alginate O-acetyltransferase complex protein AlgI